MAAELASREDITTRLNRTVCMYKGLPVYVTVEPQDVKGSNIHIVRWYNLGDTSKCGTCDYREKEFSNSSPLLGYLYHDNRALYLTRIADRRFQLGLCIGNVHFGGSSISYREIFLTKEMENCILGKHRTYAEAKKMLANGVESVPIHRHFAISKAGKNITNLHYRGETIAIKLSTAEEFSFIHPPKVVGCYKEIMQREGVHLC